MDELTIEDKKYLSSRQAAKVTGYAKDYVGQLCREGRVEARLVGRNWYVLEESILEHRFGPVEGSQKVEETKNDVDSSWQTPVYKTETVTTIPEMTPKVSPQPENHSMGELTNPTVLADMQSAWQDWFKAKEIEAPEAPEMLEEHYDHADELTQPLEAVAIERIHEDPVEEVVEEYVPVAITRQASVAQEESEAVGVEEIPLRSVESVRRAPRARRNRRKRTSRAVVNAVIVSIAVLGLVVASIGSGAADAYLEKKSFVSPVTNLISGTTVIESNK